MASDLNDAVFPEEDLDDDDETQEDEEEDDEDDDVLGEPDYDDDDETEPPPSVLAAVTVAAPDSAASKTASIPVAVADSSPKRQRTEQIEEKKVLDDSRRLFQRLWTDEDEIGLLQGFLEYTARRGSSHHNDTALFYDQIKSKLQLGFNKNQLVEKLRRVLTDRATFEISRRIWSNTAPITGPVEDDDEINPNPNFGHSAKTPLSRKRSRPRSEKRELNHGSALNKDNNCIGNSNNNNNKDNENCNSRNNVQVLIEETVRSCLSPVLKQLASSGMGLGSAFGFGGRGFALNPLPTPLSFLNLGIGEMAMDEKWRKQQILELQVYSKRLELVQDEIKVALEELRSAGGG
ncbi:Mediator-associated protein 1 [Spatholobus suberectus]|nr:Mediator-associated protein 1 [Spatholobus suberectus]